MSPGTWPRVSGSHSEQTCATEGPGEPPGGQELSGEPPRARPLQCLPLRDSSSSRGLRAFRPRPAQPQSWTQIWTKCVKTRLSAPRSESPLLYHPPPPPRPALQQLKCLHQADLHLGLGRLLPRRCLIWASSRWPTRKGLLMLTKNEWMAVFPVLTWLCQRSVSPPCQSPGPPWAALVGRVDGRTLPDWPRLSRDQAEFKRILAIPWDV